MQQTGNKRPATMAES